MTIRAKYKIDDAQIDAMDMSITLTMTVKDWRELMRLIPTTYPGWDVSRTISDALGDLSRATSRSYVLPRSDET
jgi:hypothetical protein